MSAKVKWVGQPKHLTPDEQRKKFGLGDLVSSVATPIAAQIGSPCVDPETKQLKSTSPCAKGKEWLNSVVPDVLNPFGK